MDYMQYHYEFIHILNPTDLAVWWQSMFNQITLHSTRDINGVLDNGYRASEVSRIKSDVAALFDKLHVYCWALIVISETIEQASMLSESSSWMLGIKILDSLCGEN